MLERIARVKVDEVRLLKAELDINNITPKREIPNIFDYLSAPDRSLRVIAEVKKASPLKGVLCPDFHPGELAGIYEQNGAAVISVITDNQFFQGDKGYAVEVRRQTALPILRKDFIIHEVQLYESVVLGADLVLLIAALHDYKSLLALSEKSRQLNLYPLVEVHDKKELQTVLDLPVQLIGINNRNLHDFNTSIKTSLELAGYIPDRYIKVSESGIKTRADMKQLEQAGCNAALIGETLVSSKDPGAKLHELVNYRGDE